MYRHAYEHRKCSDPSTKTDACFRISTCSSSKVCCSGAKHYNCVQQLVLTNCSSKHRIQSRAKCTTPTATKCLSMPPCHCSCSLTPPPWIVQNAVSNVSTTGALVIVHEAKVGLRRPVMMRHTHTAKVMQPASQQQPQGSQGIHCLGSH
jgi:hypothetical protein